MNRIKKIYHKIYYSKYIYPITPYLTYALIIAFIIFTFRFFGRWGWLGFLVSIVIILLVRGWRYRKVYTDTLKEMEASAFGKSLDKNNWKKGELGEYKVKVKWRKKKNDKPISNKKVSK